MLGQWLSSTAPLCCTDFLTAEHARSPSNYAPLRALWLTATRVERGPLPWTARQENLAGFLSLWTVVDCRGRNAPHVVCAIPLCRGLSTEVQVTRALVVYKKS